MSAICEVTAPTYQVKIYLSGPIEVAKQVIREAVKLEGLCVTVEPTLYQYTGGEETGYVVGLLNYPRFPTTDLSKIDQRAMALARLLLQRTFQHSALVVTPVTTTWLTDREV